MRTVYEREMMSNKVTIHSDEFCNLIIDYRNSIESRERSEIYKEIVEHVDERLNKPLPSVDEVASLVKEGLAWAMVYGPVIHNDQWDEMRDTKANEISARIGALFTKER